MLNVTNYNPTASLNADPTGINDSTQAIFTALNYIAAGESIYFPAGTYLVKKDSNYPLTLPPNTTVFGDGAASIIKANPAFLGPLTLLSTAYPVIHPALSITSVSTPAAVTITGLTNGAPIVISTGPTNHLLSSCQQVTIAGISGGTSPCTAANGTWTITRLTSTTFQLNNSVGNGTGIGAGTPTVQGPNIITASNSLTLNQLVPVSVTGALGNTAINGNWTATVLSSTTLSLNGSVGGGTYTGSGTVLVGQNKNVAIHDLLLDGGGQTTGIYSGVAGCHGIDVYNATNVRIDDVTIRNMGIVTPGDPPADTNVGGFGIFINDQDPSSGLYTGPVSNVRINRCTVSNIAGGGIDAGDGIYAGAHVSSNVRDIVVDGCWVSTVGRHCYTTSGPAPYGPIDVRFVNCYGERSALAGVDNEIGSDVVIDNCVFYQCGNDQTYYNPMFFYKPGYGLFAGVAANNSCSNIVVSNTHFDGCYYGVAYAGASGLSIRGCKFENSIASDCAYTGTSSGPANMSLTDNFFASASTISNVHSASSGNLTASAWSIAPTTTASTSGLASVSVTGVTSSGTLIQISTFPTNHGLTSGQTVMIAGVSGVPANGQWTVSTTSSTAFNLVSSTYSGSYISGGTVYPSVIVSCTNTLMTGQTVLISGTVTALNGHWTVTALSGSQFSLNGSYYATAQPSVSVAFSMLITTSGPHGLIDGQGVTISGTSADGNGDRVVSYVDATHFSPDIKPNSSTGGSGASGTISPDVVVTTTSAHGYTSGQLVRIQGVLGNAPANGVWKVIVPPTSYSGWATTFSLSGARSTSTYSGGGTSGSQALLGTINSTAESNFLARGCVFNGTVFVNQLVDGSFEGCVFAQGLYFGGIGSATTRQTSSRQRISIIGCEFYDCPGAAIDASSFNSTQGLFTYDVLVSACQFNGNGNLTHGVLFGRWGGFGWMITDCIFNNCATAAIMHLAPSNLNCFSAVNNTIIGGGGGIVVAGSISDSAISGNMFSGITTAWPISTRITGVTYAGTTVTVTTGVANGLAVGNKVTITGVGGLTNVNNYQVGPPTTPDVWTVASITPPYQFTFTASNTPTGTYTSGGTVLLPVTAASGSPIVVTTGFNHGLSTGQIVFIQGVTGNTAANGVWSVTSPTANTFTLVTPNGVNSATNATYGSGGLISLSPGYCLMIGQASSSFNGLSIANNAASTSVLNDNGVWVYPLNAGGTVWDNSIVLGNIMHAFNGAPNGTVVRWQNSTATGSNYTTSANITT